MPHLSDTSADFLFHLSMNIVIQMHINTEKPGAKKLARSFNSESFLFSYQYTVGMILSTAGMRSQLV